MTTGNSKDQAYVTHEELDKEIEGMEKDLATAIKALEDRMITSFKVLDDKALTKVDFYEYMNNWHQEKLRNGKVNKPSEPLPAELFLDNDMKQTLIKLLIGAIIALSGVGAGVAASLGVFQ